MREQIRKIELGKKYYDDIGEVKVLCFVEKKYLALKRPKCMPFIMSSTAFSLKYRENK